MAARDPNGHRRNNSTPPIPLQDFSQPRPRNSGSETDSESSGNGRQRAASDAPRRRFRRAQSGQYAPLARGDRIEEEQADNNEGRRLGLRIPDATTGAEGVTPTSPATAAAFQSAMAGLSFGPEIGDAFSRDRYGGLSAPTQETRTPSLHSLDLGGDGDSVAGREGSDYFPGEASNDKTPLTHPKHLAPISGSRSAHTTPTGKGPRSRSVRFSNASPSGMSGSRLGDDLAAAEAGMHHGRSGSDGIRRRSSSIRRNLSPNTAAGSTLLRAGTIVRNMSTRIVNLSNEQDVVDRTIKRRGSTKDGRDSFSSSITPEPLPSFDGPVEVSPGTRLEKTPSAEESEVDLERHALSRRRSLRDSNPLRGKSWGIFPADSPIRMKLCDILVHPFTEPFIFALIVVQTVVLAVDSNENNSSRSGSRSRFLGKNWTDWFMLVLFSIYTVEIIARSIVSGFVVNPVEYSTINRQVGVRQAMRDKVNQIFGTPHTRRAQAETNVSTFGFTPQQPGILRSFTNGMAQETTTKGGSKAQRRARLAHRAFLRHSFNRVDFIAVCSYWISFLLSSFSVEQDRHLYVFRMLSALRIMRLLYLTSGTTVILRSLKKAATLLVNVAFLIGFFWLLFAIIGLQCFKSSLRRTCVWIDPDDASNTWVNQMQFCGGWLADNGTAMPWLLADGKTPGAAGHKGFLCPVQSKCIEGQNPYNGSVSFDNIFQSLELVFVIMSSNTFSDLLYYLTQSDYLAAAIFFACGIIFLFFWLVNLLIAVITSSFQVIREEGKASAFTGEDNEQGSIHDDAIAPQTRKNALVTGFRKTKWVWIAVIVAGLVVQCLRSATMHDERRKFINTVETIVTLVLLMEIIIRFLVDWRHFFRSKSNIADLLIAVITTVMQIPAVHNSGQLYAWLTFFQIIRIYRVVLAVPITRDLIMTVLGNFTGLLNLIMFVFLFTFLAAILASQMFRGSLPATDSNGDTINVTFNNMWNSFLGMYTILSSENWTTIVYNVTNYDIKYNTAWMGAAFFILWFVLANFITLNMFIAVIQENFDISEDEKRLQQVKAFLQQKEMGASAAGNLSLSTIFSFGRVMGKKRDPLSYGNATTEMLLKDAVVRDFLDQDESTPLSSPPTEEETPALRAEPASLPVGPGGSFSSWWQRLKTQVMHQEPNPFYSRLEFSKAYEDLDPRTMAKEVMSARERRKRAQREFLRKHPTYNVSLFVFGPRNPIRRICQRIVGPGRGEVRSEGVDPSVPVWYAFSAFIYCAIVAMVVLACVTTPLYQKEYFLTHKFSVKNWFVFTDMGFALLFSIEAAIKVVADGFFFTPNAYFRGSWGLIDGVVLITLWINVASSLFNEGQVSRAVGAFKALRALRLLNVSDSARNNFHAVIVRGGLKVLSAAFVSISLLIPFAIYGLNLFVGKMQSCNDGGSNITDLRDCVGEYMTNSSPSNWNILAPRVVSNPYYSFDNFGDSLFILFQIVSQEGWTDVMWQAVQITAVGKQPQPFSSYGNAVFFVVFNLLGAVFVLTLFVSVFMRNYTEQTGVAYLTAEQRSWLELRKLLRQISPSKRPLPNQKRENWKEWCYRRAVRKTGKWSRFVTGMLILHLILLCIEFYPSKQWWDITRNALFVVIILICMANSIIRIIGLTWPRFRRSSWDIYALISVSMAFITSVLALGRSENWVIIRLQRLALVSMALLLIPRNNQLDQLFKTAAASLPLISNLLATWFVLFLTFAIALTQAFGLTKFGDNESVNVNFRDVPKALILLFRTSVGEGWNQIMEDYATMLPPYCEIGQQFRDGDCGSKDWARFLFIAWNILSMYLFVNLFVSLIYESFSYVYQRSNGLSVISREEIRRFKQAWAEFDPDGTGYISKEAFPRLLGELSGVFEMRIYDGDFTVASLVDSCSKPRRESYLPDGSQEPREIDLKKLNARLAELPVEAIRRRRRRMNAFYEEVLVSSDPDRGIAFTSLLVILAHYNVINDNKSLRLHEFLRRRARLQRVEDAVNRNIVIGFFDTVYWSRKLREHRASKASGRMTAIPQFNVPAIFVDDQAAQDNVGFANSPSLNSSAPSSPRFGAITPPSVSGADDRAAHRNLPALRTRASNGSIQMSPTDPILRNPFLTSPTSDSFPTGHGASHGGRHPSVSHTSVQEDEWHLAPALSRPSSRDGPSPGTDDPSPSPFANHGGPARGGHGRTLSTRDAEADPDGLERRSRAGSAVSAQEVLEVLDNSAWGESIRRSFTLKRGSAGE